MTSNDLSPAERSLLARIAGHSGPTPEDGLDAATLAGLERRGLTARLGGYVTVTREGRALATRHTGGSERTVGARRRPGGARAPFSPPASPAARPAPSAEPPRAEARRAEEPVVAGKEKEDELDDVRPLSEAQEDLLRQLVLAEEPGDDDALDGRTVRALRSRGLVRVEEGRVETTAAGRAYYDRHVRRRRRARSSWVEMAGRPRTGTTRRRARGSEPGKVIGDRAARARALREAVRGLEQAVGGATPIDVGDLEARAEDAFAGLRDLADRIERGDDPRRITRPQGG